MSVRVWVCGWVFLSWCTGMDLGLRYLDEWDFGTCSEAFWSLLETRGGLLLVPGEF